MLRGGHKRDIEMLDTDDGASALSGAPSYCDLSVYRQKTRSTDIQLIRARIAINDAR